MEKALKTIEEIEALLAKISMDYRLWDHRGHHTTTRVGGRNIPDKPLPPSCYGVTAKKTTDSYKANMTPWTFEDAEFIAAAPAIVRQLLDERREKPWVDWECISLDGDERVILHKTHRKNNVRADGRCPDCGKARESGK